MCGSMIFIAVLTLGVGVGLVALLGTLKRMGKIAFFQAISNRTVRKQRVSGTGWNYCFLFAGRGGEVFANASIMAFRASGV